jgi:hypothetical protein
MIRAAVFTKTIGGIIRAIHRLRPGHGIGAGARADPPPAEGREVSDERPARSGTPVMYVRWAARWALCVRLAPRSGANRSHHAYAASHVVCDVCRATRSR